MNGIHITVRPRPRQLKWAARLGVALLGYALVGFFLVPAVLKSQLLQRLPGITKRHVAIEKVRANPFAFSLTVRGVSLTETNGAKFASLGEFYVNFQLSSLFRGAWVFDELSFKEPFVHVIVQPSGEANVSNLRDLTETLPLLNFKERLPNVRLGLLQITNGAVAFDDLSAATPFRTQITPIHLQLTDLTTKPGIGNPHSFNAMMGPGESVAWSGGFTVQPLIATGRVELAGISIRKYQPYLQSFARFETARGRADAAIDYRLDTTTNATDLAFANGSLRVTRLQLKAPGTGETVLSVPSFAVEGARASAVKRFVNVASVKSTGVAIHERRNADGSLHILSLINLPKPSTNKAPPAVAATTNAPAPKPPWIVTFDDILLEDHTLTLEDKKPARPAKLAVDQLTVRLKGLSSVSNSPFTLSASARLNEAGQLNMEGKIIPLPPSAEVKLDLTGLDLRPLQPYLEEQVKLTVNSGRLSAHGHARLSLADTNAPLVKFDGEFGVSDFAAIDQVVSKDLAKWDALTATGIDFSLRPDHLNLAEVKWSGLKTSLVIGPDGRPALLSALPPKTLGTNTPAPAAAPTFPVKLAVFVLTNASFNLSDLSVTPHCNFGIQEFSGVIKGLSSELNTTADVDLRGAVDEHAPFTVTGRINPLARDLFVDLAIASQNTDLTAFTPYMEKFGGYPLQKGKLSLALRYEIAQRQLKASNSVTINQLTLGPRNKSPDATKLPVKLAVALLKDRNGRIELDLPVKGSIDDPQFKIGPIILKVFVNVLAKAVTSPFALLGALVGGGEELSFVAFEPGRAGLTETEAKKLDSLAKALDQRPALNLEINGSVDPIADRESLAWLRLEREMKSQRMKELAGKDNAPASVEEVQLDAKEYVRLLKAAYKQTFSRSRPDPNARPPVPANDSTDGAPVAKDAKPAAKPNPSAKGAEGLISVGAGEKTPKAAPTSEEQARRSRRPASLPPLPADDATLANMEMELAASFMITDDELRDLMQERAHQVQGYLLKSGNVAAERLFLIAPKPIDALFKGESKVNLSLD